MLKITNGRKFLNAWGRLLWAAQKAKPGDEMMD